MNTRLSMLEKLSAVEVEGRLRKPGARMMRGRTHASEYAPEATEARTPASDCAAEATEVNAKVQRMFPCTLLHEQSNNS